MHKTYTIPFNALTLIAAALHCSTAHAVEKNVVFADDNLASCVAEAVDKKNLSSPEELIALTCHAKRIADATGVNRLSKLKTLSLFGNQLKAINLSGLTQLEQLNLANNALTEVNLSDNKNLKKLYLFGNRLKRLDLRSAPQLEQLKAEKNKLLTVTFGHLNELKKAHLFDNKMKDIKIDKLPMLRFLDVRSNPMPDDVYDYLDSFAGVKASHDGNTEDWQ